MRTRALSLVVASLVLIIAIVLFRVVVEVFYTFHRNPLELTLFLAPALVAASVYLLRHGWGLPAWTLLIGSTAFSMVCFYDAFIDFGITYHWVSLHDADGWLFPNGYQSGENSLVAIPLKILRCLSLVFWLGIFWLAACAFERHLTMRWSERRTRSSLHS